MITWLGCVTWPGATSANSSCRLLGFCTIPVTRQVVPTACQVPPTCASYRPATWLVSATWPGPDGYAPLTRPSIGPLYSPCGLSARRCTDWVVPVVMF